MLNPKLLLEVIYLERDKYAKKKSAQKLKITAKDVIETTKLCTLIGTPGQCFKIQNCSKWCQNEGSYAKIG